MHTAKFPLVLLAISACTAAVVVGSCNGGESGSGGGTDTGGADAGKDGGDDAGDAGDAVTSDGDADAGDAESDAAPDAAEDAEADGGDGGDAGDGGTAIPCVVADPPCPADELTCCSGFCVDVRRDPRNCGACGVACGASHFCTGQACSPAVLAHVCDNPSATVALDAYPIDDAAGSQVGAALVLRCNPSVSLRTLAASSPLLLDQATNRPNTGPGDTFVAGGGAFGQRGLAYMDAKGHSPLYVVTGPGGDLLLIARGSGTVLVDAPVSTLTDHHDYFAHYVAVEPTSGTLVLAAFGLMGKGTIAAASHFENVVAPSLSTFGKAWYVVEWTDTNGDGIPDSGDAYAPVASGP